MIFGVPWHKPVSQSLATSKSSALEIDLSMCKVVLILWTIFVTMFRVCHAFLSVHAALWSPAGKGLTALVFSSVPTNFAV